TFPTHRTKLLHGHTILDGSFRDIQRDFTLIRSLQFFPCVFIVGSNRLSTQRRLERNGDVGSLLLSRHPEPLPRHRPEVQAFLVERSLTAFTLTLSSIPLSPHRHYLLSFA